METKEKIFSKKIIFGISYKKLINYRINFS